MKKILFLIPVLLVAAFFPTIREWISPYSPDQASKAANVIQNDTGGSQPLPEKDSNTFRPDVDLTAMSSTMVFSQVLKMVVAPDTYIGRKIRMKGRFISLEGKDENANKKTYFACLIADAMACCSQGMFFEPNDADSKPASFPKEGDEIIVEGRFDVFMARGQKIGHLVDCRVITCSNRMPGWPEDRGGL